jgi:hypothetical protein
MVRAVLDDGQQLLALNEVFVGVKSHQSARYRIRYDQREERQSSSGLIVTSGTGCTGWARSIARERDSRLPLPSPTYRHLAFFVREAFPSRATGTGITEGLVGRRKLAVISENNEGGVIFGDGIEDDCLAFDWGQTVRLAVAEQTLDLVVS